MSNKLFFKKIRSCFLAGVCVLSLGICSAFAESNDNNYLGNYNEKISRGKILCGGDIQLYETIECSPESVKGELNGRNLYQKTVYITKQFKSKAKEIVFKPESEISQSFTFEYDKADSVRLVDRKTNNEVIKSNWVVSDIDEIFMSDCMCTVSNQYRVNKKMIDGSYLYISDGYVDIFCMSNGTIGINSDMN